MIRNAGNLAIKKAAPEQVAESFDLDQFRQANSAFADSFFATHNQDLAQAVDKLKPEQEPVLDFSFAQPSQIAKQIKLGQNENVSNDLVTRMNSEFGQVDFSFAKKKVESYYDNTEYDKHTRSVKGLTAFGENKYMRYDQVYEPASSGPGLGGKFNRWLDRQRVLMDSDQGKVRSEIEERKTDERYLLVEELGPQGFDRYESANYSSLIKPVSGLIRGGIGSRSQSNLTMGNLALEAAPLDDEELLERLNQLEEEEEENKQVRSQELAKLEEQINLRKLYKVVGNKRLKLIATYIATVLMVGSVFVGLLMRQARIVEANFSIASMKSEITDLQASNQESYEEIMELYDLNELKSQAMSVLGLRPASQAQRIKIVLPEADRCIIYGNEIGQKNQVKEDIIAFDYLNYQKLEHYFDSVKGIYD